jgi:hypothetical protein
MPIAHTALSAAFYLRHPAVGNGAVNKHRICLNNEHFKPRIWLFSVGKGAMNVPRYWQRRDDACTLYRLRHEISAITPRFS